MNRPSSSRMHCPPKYYTVDTGIRNSRLNFRQGENTHLMENAIYNELIRRDYAVDVGVVEMFATVDGKRCRSTNSSHRALFLSFFSASMRLALVSATCHAIRYRHARKTIAVFERTLPNGRYAVRNRYSRKTGAIECILPDARHWNLFYLGWYFERIFGLCNLPVGTSDDGSFLPCGLIRLDLVIQHYAVDCYCTVCCCSCQSHI